MVFEECAEIIENGNITEIFAQCPFAESFAGGMLGGALAAAGIILGTLIFSALYVYYSLAWYRTGKKLKYKNSWLAWIPIVNIAMFLQLGGFHWAWVFLVLIPIIGWIALFIILIIARWTIFKKRKYPGWIALAPIIPYAGGILYLISIGFLGWGKKK
tara:strand:- start:13 stop:486 length:474 start_codon:yes stop_codon:yes gene_type:complete